MYYHYTNVRSHILLTTLVDIVYNPKKNKSIFVLSRKYEKHERVP